MEFDSQTFAPLYKINIGMPGSSNAIEISKRLGLGDEIAEKAYSFLSGNKISFEYGTISRAYGSHWRIYES